MGNHQSTSARPDSKMGRQRDRRDTRKVTPRGVGSVPGPSTSVRQAEQRYANAKRRRRDRTEAHPHA